ncbi:MAG: DUF3137 domain-containing protein [Ignavibacteriales bacterium]
MVGNFEQKISDEISNSIDNINNEMLKVDKASPITSLQFILIILAVTLLCIFLANLKLIPPSGIGLGVLFSIGIPMVIISKYKDKKFAPVKKLINEFQSNLIKYINPELRYAQDDFVKKVLYYRSGIFTTTVDEYNGNSLIWGKMGQTNFMMSHLHTLVSGDNHSDTVFNGIFMVAEFNKKFNRKTLVLPDIAEKRYGSIIGNWLQKISIREEELVKLEDSEFEKRFVVYSTDQIEARYILTPSLMDKLKVLNEKFNGIAVSFIDNRIFIAIPSSADTYFYLTYDMIIDKEEVLKSFEALKNMVDTGETIINELGLNNRIWTIDEDLFTEQSSDYDKGSNS